MSVLQNLTDRLEEPEKHFFKGLYFTELPKEISVENFKDHSEKFNAELSAVKGSGETCIFIVEITKSYLWRVPPGVLNNQSIKYAMLSSKEPASHTILVTNSPFFTRNVKIIKSITGYNKNFHAASTLEEAVKLANEINKKTTPESPE